MEISIKGCYREWRWSNKCLVIIELNNNGLNTIDEIVIRINRELRGRGRIRTNDDGAFYALNAKEM